MKFFIADDDASIRQILRDIIEDSGLGDIVGECCDGNIESEVLFSKKVEILLIDLMMPGRSGIEVISQLKSHGFQGAIVVISHINSKEMISSAYMEGIEYYIVKPINKIEVLSIFNKLQENYRIKMALKNVQDALNLAGKSIMTKDKSRDRLDVLPAVKSILHDLGLAGEPGYHDLMDIIHVLLNKEPRRDEFPKLKELYEEVAQMKWKTGCPSELAREIKACEQRVRRALSRSLMHISSIGSVDYSNPVFEKYAHKFFDFQQIRRAMRDMQDDRLSPSYPVNVKKFIQVLYLEVQENRNLPTG
ncbi:response regulator [Aneurinibacillus tyrosinisolvens]|uniref:response regulator n=1 Tax=Aneurinibacillus tyrosinisolvens TaxID=1443435 RepID=UPI00063F44DC|nr:response regulator [Aneurinibacillus tyrosinisolvens]